MMRLEAGLYESVTEYAERTGISKATIKRRCEDGSLAAEKIGGAWLIRVDKPSEEVS